MKKVLFLLTLFPALAWGQVVYDAASHARTGWGNNVSVSHTTTSSSDRYMNVFVGIMANDYRIDSVKAGSTHLTIVAVESTYSPRTFVYELVAPPTGATTVQAWWGSGGYAQGEIKVVTASGAHQTTPRRSVVQTWYTGPTFSTDATTSGGDLVVDHVLSEYDGADTAGTGQTRLLDQQGYPYQWVSKESSSTSTTTMSWAIGTTAYSFLHTVVVIRPASGGADLDPSAFHGWPGHSSGRSRFRNEDSVYFHGIRLVDDNALDSAWFYFETDTASGVYAKGAEWGWPGTQTDTTVRTPALPRSIGMHRWYVKVRDKVDSVAYSDTMMVTITDTVKTTKGLFWYAQGWRMGYWSNYNEFPPDSLDLKDVDFLVWFWGSNIDTSSGGSKWKPANGDYGSYPGNVSDSVQYEYNTNRGQPASYPFSIYRLKAYSDSIGRSLLLASVADIPGCAFQWVKADSTRTQAIADEVCAWVKRKDWDGVDFNIENSGCGWGDTTTTNRWFRIWRKAIDKTAREMRKQLYMTAVPIVHPVTTLGRVSLGYLDYVVPQGQVYSNSSYLGGVGNVTNPQAPLDTVNVPTNIFSAHQLDWGPTRWYDYGTPKDKIYFLLPTYGAKWGSVDSMYQLIPNTPNQHGTPFARDIVELVDGADYTRRDTTWKNSIAWGTYNNADAAWDTLGADFWGAMYTTPNQEYIVTWIDSISMVQLTTYWLNYGLAGISLYGAEEDMRDKHFGSAPGATAWYLKDAVEVGIALAPQGGGGEEPPEEPATPTGRKRRLTIFRR